ncbi:hypothetical protein CFP59_09358 [Streptomyces malaysiensis subsp. malaysiensis]|uniref:hypothetical protein n=1 Tax=Streptomyces TaxID=1883 RepID=UPI00081F1C6B|nr:MULTISPECIES: hypothetical protein [unclassified Streptomyces]AUA17165.1 hypothetical protein CFP59_09358 [Streptomyces sp. M56]SCG12088.1 ATP-binding cassette, subfamily B [Streptomyces sp. MnatMP-M27]
MFITHRLANARLANRIIVLDRGRIAEMGTFDELVSQGAASIFFEMLKLQQDR